MPASKHRVTHAILARRTVSKSVTTFHHVPGFNLMGATLSPPLILCLDLWVFSQRQLAENRKVFWGGQTSSHSCISVPNPVRIPESSIWRDDLCYHLCNHQLLLSMAFSDPLDPYGGPIGHCASFWSMANLCFLCGVIIANTSSLANHTTYGTMTGLYIAGEEIKHSQYWI